MQGGQIVPLDLSGTASHSEAEAYCKLSHVSAHMLWSQEETVYPCAEDMVSMKLSFFRLYT